jgi:hypothetical protein
LATIVARTSSKNPEEAMMRGRQLLACALVFTFGAALGEQAISASPQDSGHSAAPAPAADHGGEAEDRVTNGQAGEIPPRPGAISGANDSDLQSAIQKALHNEPTLANDKISVSVSANTVELSGNVANGREFVTAARIARSYAGSKWLVNHIQVRRPAAEEAASPEKEKPPR